MAFQTQFIAIVAMTLDGKIARDAKHLSTTWTSREDKQFLRQILDTCDAVILGRNTYETAKRHLVKRKRNCIVFTRSVRGIVQKGRWLVLMNPTPSILKRYIAYMRYRRIAVLGGTETYSWCLKNGFINELYVTVEPIVFGSGLPLFSNVSTRNRMQFISSKTLNKKGTVLLKYRREM